MKQLLLLVFVIFLSIQLQAQIELEVQPNPYVKTFALDLSKTTSKGITNGIIINKSSQTIDLKWSFTTRDTDCPLEWVYQVCDNNNCYGEGVLTNVGGPVNQPVTLGSGDTSILQVYFIPVGVAGCCQPKVELSVIDNPNDVLATGDFDICIEAVSSVNDTERANLRVFPNPTANYISVSNNSMVRTLWVSNILGKRVRTFSTSPNGHYDVSDLPDGIYLISMVGEENKVFKTVRLSKRNIRP